MSTSIPAGRAAEHAAETNKLIVVSYLKWATGRPERIEKVNGYLDGLRKSGKEIDLIGVDLHGLNLTGLNLKGFNPRGANLTGANLTGTTLD